MKSVDNELSDTPGELVANLDKTPVNRFVSRWISAWLHSKIHFYRCGSPLQCHAFWDSRGESWLCNTHPIEIVLWCRFGTPVYFRYMQALCGTHKAFVLADFVYTGSCELVTNIMLNHNPERQCSRLARWIFHSFKRYLTNRPTGSQPMSIAISRRELFNSGRNGHSGSLSWWHASI